MTFRVKKGRGFGDEGMVFTVPVIARKFNGYKVQAEDGEGTAFLCFEDIDILALTDEEKALDVEL